ncbi:MAG: hypothetical protein IJ713_07815 [Oscillibacter sp.]|nr:hypothetical protein [Oscillibacter sp.]
MLDVYNGHRVVAVEDADVAFWEQLFSMLGEMAGPTRCLRTDPELWQHYCAIMERLAVLSNAALVDGSDVSPVVLYLSD